MAFYQVSTPGHGCCFGSFETTLADDKHIAPRKASKPIIQRRASLPRAVIRGTALSVPSALVPYTPQSSCPASEMPRYFYAVPSTSTPTLETPEGRAVMARQIAEAVAPGTLARRHQNAWKEYKRREEEYHAHEETKKFRRAKQRYIEEEAIRRVRDRNRRNELRLLEERWRDDLKHDIQSPSFGARSRHDDIAWGHGSRDRLVVIRSSSRNPGYIYD